MGIESFDFLKENFYILLYGLAFILSLIKYRIYFDSVLKYLPILIGYTFLTELLGNIIFQNENFQIVYENGTSFNNSIVYNIYDVIFFLYFFYVFWQIIENKGLKKIIGYGTMVFILTSLINPLFQSFLLYPQIYAISIGTLQLIICIVFYFMGLKGNKPKKILTDNLLFWICLGLLTFYPFYPYLMYAGIYQNLIYTERLMDLHVFLITVMYSLFIIGFLRMKRLKHL